MWKRQKQINNLQLLLKTYIHYKKKLREHNLKIMGDYDTQIGIKLSSESVVGAFGKGPRDIWEQTINTNKGLLKIRGELLRF